MDNDINHPRLEINVGDKYQVTGQQRSVLWTTNEPPIYTVTKIDGRKIHWDCVGRKTWYKIVDRSMIEEHVLDLKDLVRIN